MSEEFKNMDDRFRQMAEEIQAKYNPAYWNDAKAKLDDASLDDAFRVAASTGMTMPSFENLSSDIDDAFMDDAFASAAGQETVAYHPDFFEGFKAIESDLQMNEAFSSAADNVGVVYEPQFWGDADQALQNEGLHYEYNSSYWQEARKMLDRADRKNFFFRWSAVAAILLLLSFGGVMNMSGVTEFAGQNTAIDKDQALFLNKYKAEHDVEIVSQESLKSILAQNFENFNKSEILNEDLDLFVNNESSDHIVNDGNDVTEPLTTENLIDRVDQPNRSIKYPLDELIEIHNILDLVVMNHNERMYKEDFNANINNEDIGDLAERLESPSVTNIFNNPKTRFNLNETKVDFDKYYLHSVNSLSFYAHAGIGNKYGSPVFTPTWRNTFGVEYLNTSYKRRKHIEFGGSFAINHIRQNNLGTERRVNIYTKQGDVNKSWFKVKLRDILYMNANFLVNYRFNETHKVKFGLGVERLMSVKSNMSYQLSGDEEITTVNNNWGVKEGITKYDFRISLGYEFKFNDAFSMQLVGNYGLRDRSDDEFFRNNIVDRETNITFGLKYNFMQRM